MSWALKNSGGKAAILAVLLIVLLASACTTQTSADPGVVNIALDQTPDNLDPRIGQNAASQRLDSLIFNSLVKKNERSELIPDLALRWDLPDPTTYVFHLRDDVRFHDGRPLTSKDVRFTFRSILDGAVRTLKSGHPYNLIKEIDTPDPQTVVFKLKEPFAPFLWNLANGVIGIVPDGSPADFNSHPIGSGPFEFVHHIQDPEEVVAALELRKGSVDLELNSLAPDMVEVLKHDDRLNVTQSPGTNYQYIA